MLEYVRSVVIQVGALFSCELTDPDTGVDPPRIQQFVPDFGDDDQLMAARERNVALVEQRRCPVRC